MLGLILCWLGRHDWQLVEQEVNTYKGNNDWSWASLITSSTHECFSCGKKRVVAP